MELPTPSTRRVPLREVPGREIGPEPSIELIVGGRCHYIFGFAPASAPPPATGLAATAKRSKSTTTASGAPRASGAAPARVDVAGSSENGGATAAVGVPSGGGGAAGGGGQDCEAGSGGGGVSGPSEPRKSRVSTAKVAPASAVGAGQDAATAAATAASDGGARARNIAAVSRRSGANAGAPLGTTIDVMGFEALTASSAGGGMAMEVVEKGPPRGLTGVPSDLVEAVLVVPRNVAPRGSVVRVASGAAPTPVFVTSARLVYD